MILGTLSIHEPLYLTLPSEFLTFSFQNDFSYNSSYWTNKIVYAVEDGLEGLTEKQTKLASYWNTPFNKICLGMKVNNVTNWIVVNRQASSLFSEIADGTFKNTTAGKDEWKSLIDGSSLQANCNKEGYNFHKGHSDVESGFIYMKIRIGIVANNQNDCDTPNTCIGFGISARGCHIYARNTTCGNLAICGWFNNTSTAATLACRK